MKFRILHILLITKFMLLLQCYGKSRTAVLQQKAVVFRSVTKFQLEVSSKTPCLRDKAASPYTVLQFIVLSKACTL